MPADRDRRGALAAGPPDGAAAPPQGEDLQPGHRGPRRRGARLGERQHDAAPRRGDGDGGKSYGDRTPATRRDAATSAGRGRVEARRRPRPPLRRRLGRPQPDPHALPDREAARLPGGDRPRDVDQGARPRRARAACPTPSPSRSPSGARSSSRRVEFGSDAEADQIHFFVRDAKKKTPHLEGSVK